MKLLSHWSQGYSRGLSVSLCLWGGAGVRGVLEVVIGSDGEEEEEEEERVSGLISPSLRRET